MRITAATLYRDSNAAIERTSEQLLEYQRQVSSGKRIGRPSDDPSGTATVITERSEHATVEQYERAADSVTARLTVVDTALSDIISRLTHAQTAALAARGSSVTPVQREAAAQAIEGTRQAIFEDLNTTFHGAHLFGGADALAPPFSVSGGVVSAYQGSGLEVEVEIDKGRDVVVAIDGGRIAQGGAAQSVFAVLDALAVAARAGDHAALGQGIDDLKAAFERATIVQSSVGTDLASIETHRSQLSQRKVATETRIAAAEDADVAAAITGMAQADTAYRTALAATGKITKNSLMDYLS